MNLSALFYAKVDLDVNSFSDESLEDAKIPPGIEILINGTAAFLRTTSQNKYKLTRLICFLNPDGPRKIFKKEHFSKSKLIESTSLKGEKHFEKMEYSHIEICLKFENPGNYFIILFKHLTIGRFQIYVRIKETKETRCVFKMFKKISDLDKNVLKSLRHSIKIYIAETEENDNEDGQMNVYYEEFLNNMEFVASIEAVINEGSYEFYLDKDGITKEKVKIVETNFQNYKT